MESSQLTARSKMNRRFCDLQGGLFLDVAKADVGEAAGNFQRSGGDNMAWADPFYPDPSVSEKVKEAIRRAVDEGIFSHYCMPIGLLELRQTLARVISAQTGLPIDPSRNVIVTPGSDSGLLYAMMPFVCEGDEVLVPDPSYPSNFLNPKLLGGVTVPVPLYEEDGYQPRIEEFERRLTPRTKMVLLTHPNNPTTTVFRRERIEALCRFIVENDLILVSDQAFQDHVFDDIHFVHPCTLPGMWERTLTVCSISKGIGLSGFRVGYIYADDVIMDVLYGGAVNVLGATSTLSSIGAVAALQDEEHLREMYLRLERRRRAAYTHLSAIPGVVMSMSESGILTWLNISRLGSADEVVERLMGEAGVLVNNGAAYGRQGEGHVRIVSGCFLNDSTAEERFVRIRSTLTNMSREKGLC